MLNPQTQLKMSKPRSKIRKVSHPINKDSSLLANSWKTAELSPTITFKKNQLSIWFSDSEEVCKSSWKPSLERPSHSMLNPLTQLKMSKPRSKIRKVSHPINKDLSSLVNSLKMEELLVTTIFKKNQPYTWSSDWEEVCKSLLRPWLERPSHSMLNPQTQLRMSRLKSKIKKESHLINRDSSLQANN